MAVFSSPGGLFFSPNSFARFPFFGLLFTAGSFQFIDYFINS
jgi:hypothetical protein